MRCLPSQEHMKYLQRLDVGPVLSIRLAGDLGYHSPALCAPHIPMGRKEKKGSLASGPKPRTNPRSLFIFKCVP